MEIEANDFPSSNRPPPRERPDRADAIPTRSPCSLGPGWVRCECIDGVSQNSDDRCERAEATSDDRKNQHERAVATKEKKTAALSPCERAKKKCERDAKERAKATSDDKHERAEATSDDKHERAEATSDDKKIQHERAVATKGKKKTKKQRKLRRKERVEEGTASQHSPGTRTQRLGCGEVLTVLPSREFPDYCVPCSEWCNSLYDTFNDLERERDNAAGHKTAEKKL